MDNAAAMHDERRTRARQLPAFVAPMLIGVAVLLTYANTFRGPFVFDDIPSIVRNEGLRTLWPAWRAAGLDCKDDITIAGRPLVAYSLALNYAISGLDIWSYRVGNLLIHIAAALLLWDLLRRLLARPRSAGAVGGVEAIAFVAALCWCVHPLNAAAVTFVVQRAESLMGAFFLLTVLASVRSIGSGRRLVWEIVAVVACALGMACKEVMAVAPLAVLLIDRTLFAGGFAQALKQRRRLYGGLAAAWLILIPLVLSSPRATIATAMSDSLSPLAYFKIQIWAITRYLRLCVWPSDLVLDYGSTTIGVEHPITTPLLGACGALLLLLAAWTAWGLVRNRPAALLGAWYFLLLAPSSSVIPLPHEPVAEHRMYLPLAAVIVATTMLIHRVLAKVSRSALTTTRGVVVLGFALAAVLGLRTWQRNALFSDEARLFAADVAAFPSNVRARSNLALALLARERIEEARAQYDAALRVRPDDAESLTGVGGILLRQGRYEESIAFSRRAVGVRPNSAAALSNLGEALFWAQRPRMAIPHLEQSLQLEAGSAATMAILGDCLATVGRHTEAVAWFRRSLALDPSDAAVHVDLARCLDAQGMRAEALRSLDEAIQRLPDAMELRDERTRLQNAPP
ncbi:MAG: tetratricopeptide repeat protein [Planctomycetes bacterium]|nr:tetratricopeptide repeat protein [Planctomycetota bacterium]